MKCSSCGATVKEGSNVCPVCGEEMLWTSGYEGIRSGNPFENVTPDLEHAKKKQKEALEPVRNLYNLKLINLVLFGITLVVTFYIMIAMEGYFHDDSIDVDGLNDFVNAMTWVTRALGIVGAVILIKFIAEVGKLSEIEPSFRQAMTRGIIYAVLSIIGIFVESSLINIAEAIFAILFCKSYYDGMCDLCQPNCNEAFDCWVLYWRTYIILTISSTVIGLAFGIWLVGKAQDLASRSSWADTSYAGEAHTYFLAVYVLLAITTVLTLVSAFIEMRALKKTRDSFELLR